MKRPFNAHASLALDALILQIEDRTISRARHDLLRRHKGRLERVFLPTPRRPRR
jgi:hypothetical protein